MNNRPAIDNVVYHGIRRVRGDCEDLSGRRLGVVQHVVRHSPTGLEWGYGGSGPADTARTLLLAAIKGRGACCPTCEGSREVVHDLDNDRDIPYDSDAGHDSDTRATCIDCEDGYRQVPYQRFKWEHVAGWGDEWKIRRSEILTWLRDAGWNPPHPDNPAVDTLSDIHTPSATAARPQPPSSPPRPDL